MTLPSFLVIGAYKSGTTALHHQLRAHPDVFIPGRKEPNYFAFADATPPFDHPAARDSIRDHRDYEALFESAAPHQVVGEVSPAYLAIPDACIRIRQEISDARLIAVLRNPIERAYSDYLMYRRDGLEREPDFLRALRAQPTRDRSTDPTSHYLSTGMYAEQVRRFQQAFPRDQLHILLHDDLRSDQPATLRRIFEFVGVDPQVELADQAPSNVSGVPTRPSLRLAYSLRRRLRRSLGAVVPERVKRRVDAQLEQRLDRPSLPDEARRYLIDTYRADIELLSDLIDRDLSDWTAG